MRRFLLCRAAELAGVYRRLVAGDGSSIDARLSALMQVRGVVEGCDPHLGLAKELLQLIDREADLLNRCERVMKRPCSAVPAWVLWMEGQGCMAVCCQMLESPLQPGATGAW